MRNPITIISEYLHGTNVMKDAWSADVATTKYGDRIPEATSSLGDPNFVHEKLTATQMNTEAYRFVRTAALLRDRLRLETDTLTDDEKAELSHSNAVNVALASQAAGDAALYQVLTFVIYGTVTAIVGAIAALVFT